MRFCPNDKSLLIPVKKGGVTVLRCPKCGYEEVADASTRSAYQQRSEVKQKAEVVVVDKQVETLPKVKTRGCPRCGYDEAYFWVQQTRAADEPPTRFYRCVRCGYTWREYE